MNKYYFDGVIVVEGKSDVSYLSSFINSLYFITNGFDINQQKIDFIKRVSEVRKIIVLTDNDEAGEKIKNKINAEIAGIIDAKTAKITRKRYKKVGVAETEKDEIIKVLSPYLTTNSDDLDQTNYHLSRVISLADNPNEMRDAIVSEYRLINGNNKFLEYQLKMLKINKEEFNKKYGN